MSEQTLLLDGPGSAAEPRAEDGASPHNDGKQAVPGALLSIAPPSALPSASQLDRVMVCLGSAALPQIGSTRAAARRSANVGILLLGGVFLRFTFGFIGPPGGPSCGERGRVRKGWPGDRKTYHGL